MKNKMNTIKMIAMGCKPDPFKFKIIDYALVNGHTIVLAKYDGCLTFGGEKLMLLRGVHRPFDFETLDPHFLDENFAVIGRFVPTKLGWTMARAAAMVVT